MGYLVIFIGSIILTFSLTYLLWIEIRTEKLKEDLFDIGFSFLKEANYRINNNYVENPMFTTTLESIYIFKDNIDSISLPVLKYIKNIPNKNKPINHLITNDEELDLLIDNYIEKLTIRLNHYIYKETLSGITLLLKHNIIKYWNNYIKHSETYIDNELPKFDKETVEDFYNLFKEKRKMGERMNLNKGRMKN